MDKGCGIMFIFLLLSCGPDPDSLCNGFDFLCAQNIDSVLFAGTHRSMSTSEDAFSIPYHHASIPQQLEDGIRALHIETHMYEGRVHMCHESCSFGAKPLMTAVEEIARFLEDHPRNVIFLHFDDTAGKQQLENVFARAGLSSALYYYPEEGDFPTLETLITMEHRLLVFTNNGGTPAGGAYLQTHTYWVETPYAASTPEEWACTPLLGGTETAHFFQVSHYLSEPYAQERLAKEANQMSVLQERLEKCSIETGRTPNILLVDFYQEGSVLEVVTAHNKSKFQ